MAEEKVPPQQPDSAKAPDRKRTLERNFGFMSDDAYLKIFDHEIRQ
jgi:hypothetical protein